MLKPLDMVRLADGRKIKVISPNTKMCQRLNNSYSAMQPDSTIRTIYRKPSPDKVSAYEAILREAYFNDGFGVRVGAHNTYGFSMAYLVNIGHFTYLVYHTKDHTRITPYRLFDI